MQGFLKQGESKSTRCDEIDALIKKGCPNITVENPRGAVQLNQNKPVTNRTKDVAEKLKPDQITQIQPQNLTVNLRAGTLIFNILVYEMNSDLLCVPGPSFCEATVLTTKPLYCLELGPDRPN